MSTGPDRRTFVRGVASAVGLGAVGGLSPQGLFARPSFQAADQEVDVSIPVNILQLGKPKGGERQWKLACPNAEAQIGETVGWAAQSGLTIKLVQFKGGRSPFSDIELRPEAESAVPGNTVAADVQTGAAGRYSYLIVAEHESGVYALDPDLDIVG